MSQVTTKASLYYPPGGILMWIIVYLELFTFGAVLVAMALYSKDEASIFHESRLQLNTTFGAINTLFLLVSGFFMALKNKQPIKIKNILKTDHAWRVVVFRLEDRRIL